MSSDNSWIIFLCLKYPLPLNEKHPYDVDSCYAFLGFHQHVPVRNCKGLRPTQTLLPTSSLYTLFESTLHFMPIVCHARAVVIEEVERMSSHAHQMFLKNYNFLCCRMKMGRNHWLLRFRILLRK